MKSLFHLFWVMNVVSSMLHERYETKQKGDKETKK